MDKKQEPMNITLTTSVEGLRDLVVWLQCAETAYIIGRKSGRKELTERIKFYKEVLENKYEFC